MDRGQYKFPLESSSMLNVQFIVQDHWEEDNPCFQFFINRHGEAPTEVWRFWYRATQWSSCPFILETADSQDSKVIRVVSRLELRCGFMDKSLVTFPLLDKENFHRSEDNVVIQAIWEDWILQSFAYRGICMPICHAVTSQNLRLKFNISGAWPRYEFPANKKVDQLLSHAHPCQVLLGTLRL